MRPTSNILFMIDLKFHQPQETKLNLPKRNRAASHMCLSSELAKTLPKYILQSYFSNCQMTLKVIRGDLVHCYDPKLNVYNIQR